ncbi:MAG: hypothetical protein EOO46_14340, partial [Flavobacterium sp.]
KIVKEMVYDPCGFKLSNLQLNSESVDYSACSFELDGHKIEHRASKITPTKVGQFVTIWKRNKEGVTAPFDVLDALDFVVVTSRSGANIGQFIFPKLVLVAKGIVSQNGKDGKRGIRVYPPWDTVTNKQAETTQKWQTKYFVRIGNSNAKLDLIDNFLFDDLFKNEQHKNL